MKDPVNRIKKKHLIDQEKMFTNYTTDKELGLRIYNGLTEVNRKKCLSENWQRPCTGENDMMSHKHVRSSISVAIRKMQSWTGSSR